MKISYDPKADALYIQLRPVTPGTAENRPVTDDVTFDYAPDGKLAGIEVLDASTLLGENLDRVTFEVESTLRTGSS